MKKLLVALLGALSLLVSSCGEELLTKNSLSETFTADNINSFSFGTCAAMHFEKPPVDILYILDNSGSTLASQFNRIKSQIGQTINTISNEFDYHIYFAPLIPVSGDSLNTYPLIVADPDSLPSLASLNIVQPENLQMFSAPSGNNNESGMERAKILIDANRSNGIFRNAANTLVVMISNGDDNAGITDTPYGKVYNPSYYASRLLDFKRYTKKYADSNTVSNPMNAESVRFLSLVAHTPCSGWTTGTNYQKLSRDLYNYQAFTDDSNQSTYDICTGNFVNVFTAVNNSIKAVAIGHKYDYAKISSANEAQIQANQITVTKILPNGSTVSIPESTTNGFEYIGLRTNQNTRYEPTPGEPATGLIVKLNGTARTAYTSEGSECIIAKTQTPTEYFGYIALPREPDLTSLNVIINGTTYSQSATHGWEYMGWLDTQNIKVPGPTSAAITPPLNKTGYFLKLNGNAIFTNGDTIKVLYKPKSL